MSGKKSITDPPEKRKTSPAKNTPKKSPVPKTPPKKPTRKLAKEKKPKKKTPPKQKIPEGRPYLYSSEFGEAICKLLISGISLRKICLDERMPNQDTVYSWLAKEPEFSEKYIKAREIQAGNLLDEIPEIADDSSLDEVFTDEGKRLLNSEFVQRSRLRVEARLKYAAKICPRKYGEKIAAEVSGVDGEPIKSTLTVEFIRPTKETE